MTRRSRSAGPLTNSVFGKPTVRSRVLWWALMGAVLFALASCQVDASGGVSADGLRDSLAEPTAAAAADEALPESDADPAEPETGDAALPPVPSTSPEPTPLDDREGEFGQPARGNAADDRVVVASLFGEVYTVDPDGENRLDLVVAGEAVGAHPVWSPDGKRIAWSQEDGQGFSIASANIDGSERREAASEFNGYFGYWDPTSTRLGFLGNAVPGTGLVLDEGSGAALDVVDSDTFYYYSWSPDGTQWVVHGGSGLRVMSLDGTVARVNIGDGAYRAPTWAPDGSILIAVSTDEGNVVGRLNIETANIEPLLGAGDVVNFVLDPTGRFLAVESVAFDGDGTNEEPSLASTSTQPPVALQAVELLVVDMATGDVVLVYDGPTAGFWWSPDGSKLAALVADSGRPGFTRWLVSSEGTGFTTQAFLVTPTYAQSYAPFFDQFAQSVTPWSPDSSRFVYTAIDAEGRPGVFVQEATPDTPPTRIADDGVIAFWSPT